MGLIHPSSCLLRRELLYNHFRGSHRLVPLNRLPGVVVVETQERQLVTDPSIHSQRVPGDHQAKNTRPRSIKSTALITSLSDSQHAGCDDGLVVVVKQSRASCSTAKNTGSHSQRTSPTTK